MVNARLPFTAEDYFGRIVAHELSHGINVYHHGSTKPTTPDVDSAVENSIPSYIIHDISGRLITMRTFHLLGGIGEPQGQQSGDLKCFMAYNPNFAWALHDHILRREYFEVPVLAVGTNMCNSPVGTSINTGGKYFGDAHTRGNPKRGNCLSQIKFK